MLKKYLAEIVNQTKKGDSREESYYGYLSKLISEVAENKFNKKIDITTLPKKTEAGNPDFRVWDGSHKVIGYIEAKSIGANLDDIEESEQLKRYLHTFPNVILTNYTEFRLYREGELSEKVSIARPVIIKKLTTKPPIENEDEFFCLIDKFLSYSIPKSLDAKSLAIELAKRTRFLKDEIVAEELKTGTESIHGFYEAFKNFLIADLDEEAFADLYSQTITYGLFSARLRSGNDFNRKLAYTYIPQSIGILRDIFNFISLDRIPKQMEFIIDDIASVLYAADVKKILDEYYKSGKGKDPVLHFYETFLAEYDPETREKRGVYYTPEPVVSFIVRSMNYILKEKFGLRDGLASDNLTLLDPAGGTLGFLSMAVQEAVKEFEGKYGKGAVTSFIKDKIIKNYYSFELMMAPYAIGHMKMSFMLEELGYKMADDERIKYYLTNTLEMKEIAESKFPGMSSLSHENREAGKVKNQIPILAIIGNPPYSGHSSNTGEWISEEIKAYYKIGDKPLNEKNSKWLQDDYVKFIRFAQWKIDRAGEGAVGFITNHSYLDSPTFRGMRYSLMQTFDEIYIVDLHGNSLKKEKSPDGKADENVFDIMQGVSIVFFIKNKSISKKGIYHHEIFGTREDKYDWLNKNSIDKLQFKELKPQGEFYLFIPQNIKSLKSYNAFNKITDIFPINSVGIVTARDALTIGWTKDEIWNRIKNFAKLEPELARATYDLGKDAQDWTIVKAQKDIKESGIDKNLLTPVLYRPFDMRFTYYTGKSQGFICRPRSEVMNNFLSNNIALCIGRQGSVTGSENYDICYMTKHIVDFNLFRRGGELVFPLIIYPQINPHDLFSGQTEEPKYNIDGELLNKFKQINKAITPESILFYIYAVVYCNKYRVKYAEFLKGDFPRIPFTSNYKLFKKLASYGEELAQLHLLESKELEKPIAKFPEAGNNTVVKITYDDNKVWINDGQYFSGVKEDVYAYQIGGYQVCNKWLKDRKDKQLTTDEIQTYCKIVTALSKTIKLQSEIDEFYDEVEETLLT